ncbi:MAG: DUF262 domain-containing protein, partial [Chryseobacterium sp.]
SKELHNRYFVTSNFFNEKFGLDFTAYLQNNPEFKKKNQNLIPAKKGVTSFDDLRINKPEPSSTAIDDICRQMEKQKFLIRPPYQRNEVIDKKKSSSIIESILLGIKLPPIFIFQRNDDISEVLDGQQRLLSILGYMGKPYIDEDNKERFSSKNGYSLNLKNGILKNLNGKTFEQLSKEERDKIKNFDLWMIEIKEKNNEQFEQIDLFIRLNNKPYPIKEDTFEMWNSYISREVIESIKSVHRNNKSWFYLRKNNTRMEDENIYTSLIFMQFQVNRNLNTDLEITKHLDIYKVGEKINFRVKSKIEVSKVLETSEFEQDFVKACFDFEFVFLKKLKLLLSDEEGTSSSASLMLDRLFNKENNKRTQQSFYALWYFLYDIPELTIIKNKNAIKAELFDLFRIMKSVSSKLTFDENVKSFKAQFAKIEENFHSDLFERMYDIAPVPLGLICTVHSGYNQNSLEKYSRLKSTQPYPFAKDVQFECFIANATTIATVTADDKEDIVKELFDDKNKIVIRKSLHYAGRISAGILEDSVIVGSNYFVLSMNRSGFRHKFILGLLSSRLFGFYFARNVAIVSEFLLLNSQALRNLPVPILSLENQKPIVKMVEYVERLRELEAISNFFRRVIDGLVYELYFPEVLYEYGVKISPYVESLPELTGIEDPLKLIEQQYNEISMPNHGLSSSLFKMLNFEGLFKSEDFPLT